VASSARRRGRDLLERRWGVLGLVTASASALLTTWLLLEAFARARASSTPPWTLARASGITCYGLLTLLVGLGLLLAHPNLRGGRILGRVARIRLHASLAVFTLAFLLLHVVVLATDPWAHVGWAGVLLPLASHYRPVPVTLGVLAAWSGLVSGLTAAYAGRWLGSAWWAAHRVASLAFLLAWAHGLSSGSDSPALVGMYLASGGAILAIALSRYRAPTVADSREHEVVGSGTRYREEVR
jgi:hypothetical protein